jgi:hypothetical protein
MTHGYSKAVISILLNAAKKGKRFKMMVTGSFFLKIKKNKKEDHILLVIKLPTFWQKQEFQLL